MSAWFFLACAGVTYVNVGLVWLGLAVRREPQLWQMPAVTVGVFVALWPVWLAVAWWLAQVRARRCGP